ncbi:hypothetical protein [Nocardioides sp. KR10-350]|uniref:hypothetical protein n=1 Tax=Nocardioides cheoyonin TaxID=3156615 RepID=UPI0032B58286
MELSEQSLSELRALGEVGSHRAAVRTVERIVERETLHHLRSIRDRLAASPEVDPVSLEWAERIVDRYLREQG